jgi:hypothetical protein
MLELSVAAEEMKNTLVGTATGGSIDENQYRRLRGLLVGDDRTKSRTPRFVHTCRTGFEFWEFIKHKFSTYAERRKFLWDEFNPLIEHLEAQSASPITEEPHEVLTRLNWENVQTAWRKALERKTSDPEGAITAARTLLEATCKHILDEAKVTYDPKVDLPKLYALVGDRLNLSPSQHVEKIFKQVLGGCTAVVEGLGAIRSKLGDAHGQGKRPVKPAPRHAELVVNLAGAMATFLAATWEAAKGSPGP